MKQCPGCIKSTKTSERIETKDGKSWLITFCAKCGYNYDLELYAGEILSPQQEMDRYPDKTATKYWPGL